MEGVLEKCRLCECCCGCWDGSVCTRDPPGIGGGLGTIWKQILNLSVVWRLEGILQFELSQLSPWLSLGEILALSGGFKESSELWGGEQHLAGVWEV